MSPADKGQAEPSMEEILASIRRIISDDQEEDVKPDAPTDAPPADTPAAPAAAAPAAKPATATATAAPAAAAPAAAAPAAPPEPAAEEVVVTDAPPVEGAEEMVLEEIVEDEPAAPVMVDDPMSEPAADLAEAGRDAFLAEAEPAPADDSGHTVDDSLEPVGDSGLDKRLPSLHSDAEHVGLVSPPVREQSTLTFAELAGAIHARGFSLGNVGMTLEDLIRDLLRPHLKDWLDRNLPGIVERMVRAEIERMVREAEERKDLL